MDVVFAVMPFADVGRPSMGVGLLSAEARAAGYSTSVEYCNISLAERMGLDLYQKVATSFPPDMLIGEWFFADDVFGDEVPPSAEFLERIFAPIFGADSELVPQMLEARKLRAAYLDECARKILAQKPKIVGFTTTFHQTCACLAIARRLKAAADPPVIIFGGANCEGEMGLQLLRSFEWIDFVCAGEADVSFLRLLDELIRGQKPGPIPGVYRRGQAEPESKAQVIRDLNALPFPDFDAYFDQLASSSLAGAFEANVVLETSRGCWWGAKHHCTFCGLNGDTMMFRSKSPERAFEEIEFLAKRHNVRKIGCVDNILDMRYVDTLFPRLAESGLTLEMFYEVKANLRHTQLVAMRAGGIRQIQPGIESFSDEVLKLMDKGCTGFQNIQLMRWCEELDIEVAWNLLAGFPGESPEEYERMAELVPLLTHLTPPYSCSRVRLDRFSPFHTNPEKYGFHRVRPARAYYYVFPLGRMELSRIAYFFDFDYENGRDPGSYIQKLQHEVGTWWRIHREMPGERPRLDAWFEGDEVRIEDTRLAGTAAEHQFAGLAAAIYFSCDVAARPETLAKSLGASTAEVVEILEDLLLRRLMLTSGGKYLSLAVFRSRAFTPAHKATEVHVSVPKTPAAEPLLHLV